MLACCPGRACPLGSLRAATRPGFCTCGCSCLQRTSAAVDMLLVQFDHEKLDVYSATVEFISLAHRIIAALPAGYADLADQLQRAATSIALNIGEGAGEYSKPE